MGGVDPPGWGPAGSQWNKKQASLCGLANCCSGFSEGPLAAGVTSGFHALVGNRLLLAVDFGTAAFHDKESIASNRRLLWALDGEADALDHIGVPGLCCASIYFMRCLCGCYPLQLYIWAKAQRGHLSRVTDFVSGTGVGETRLLSRC